MKYINNPVDEHGNINCVIFPTAMNGYHSQRTEVACTSLYNVRIPFSPLLVIIVPFHVQSFIHLYYKDCMTI